LTRESRRYPITGTQLQKVQIGSLLLLRALIIKVYCPLLGFLLLEMLPARRSGMTLGHFGLRRGDSSVRFREDSKIVKAELRVN